MEGFETKGKFKLTRDPAILEQVELGNAGLSSSPLYTPGLWQRAEDEQAWDDLHIQPLPRQRTVHNLFLEYHGGSEADSVTIIPVSINFDFLAGFRRGISSRNGFAQELAFKWLHPFRVSIHPCHKVKGHNTLVGDDRTVDWLCSRTFRHLANHQALMYSDRVRENLRARLTEAARNVWNTLEGFEQPHSLLCAGIEIKDPQISL